MVDFLFFLLLMFFVAVDTRFDFQTYKVSRLVIT